MWQKISQSDERNNNKCIITHDIFRIYPGKTWQIADLKKLEQPEGKSWGWTLWETTVPVNDRENIEVCCKAIDSSYNCQPESVAPIWNLRGVLSTAWHRVKITVPPDQDWIRINYIRINLIFNLVFSRRKFWWKRICWNMKFCLNWNYLRHHSH